MHVDEIAHFNKHGVHLSFEFVCMRFYYTGYELACTRANAPKIRENPSTAAIAKFQITVMFI